VERIAMDSTGITAEEVIGLVVLIGIAIILKGGK
jgi:hypothetical protein